MLRNCYNSQGCGKLSTGCGKSYPQAGIMRRRAEELAIAQVHAPYIRAYIRAGKLESWKLEAGTAGAGLIIAGLLGAAAISSLGWVLAGLGAVILIASWNLK